MDIIENAAYRSEWPKEGIAKLVDGIYREKYTEDSASELVVALYPDAYAFGDLNGDGAGDAAVVLATSGGGSGTFMTLEVLRNDDGAPHHAATAQLGDRAQIESITIEAGVITVRMITHGPDDPMCCPTQNVTQTYQLQGEELTQLSSEVESDEPPAYVELADGTRCAFAGRGATLAFDGKRLNYTCETAGDDEVGLIGDLVQQGEDWVAEKAIIGHDDTGFFLKESEMVTVLIVEE